MLKILKFAKQYWYIMVIILMLLFVQANCDLALPEYTSKIVDVGIQSSGVESPIPDKLRSTSYNNLMLIMTEDEMEVMSTSYTKEDDFYILKEELSDQTKEELNTLLTNKETIMTMLYADGEEAEAMKAEMYSSMGVPTDSDIMEVFAMMPKEAVLKIVDSINEKISGMSDLIGESSAISYVIAEYDAQGIDMDQMQMDYLKQQGIRMLLLALLGMVMAVIVTYLSAKLAAKVSMNLRNRVFKQVVKFSNAEMNNFSTASLITRCTNDIQQVQLVLTMFFRIVAYAPILGIGGVFKVIQTGSGMGWIIGVAVGTILALVGSLLIIAMPKFKMMQTLVDQLNLVSREILTGIPVIRAFGREDHEKKRFDEASVDLMKTQLFTNRTMAFMMPTMMFIMNGITVLIIWVGAHGIETGELQVGTMMAFITYTMQIVISFLMITMVSIMIPRGAVAATRIEEVLNTEVIIDDPKQPKHFAPKTEGVVSFENVSFSYANADEEALSEISFIANSGETTAIIGSTGCGKTSLVQLIPRLFDVTNGSVKIDGIDVRDLELSELRNQIGYVPQKGVLFSGTIASNIGFGIKDITRTEIEEAAAIAQATEFIEEKEEKMEAPISQGGTNVSGGQKQRIAIARALAKKPKILIFDDSFSALDYRTDKKLRDTLHQKTKDATVIIVAQRISTILNADKIIVLDDGKVVGEGTHKQLLADNEVYQQIASSQLSEEELNQVASGREAE